MNLLIPIETASRELVYKVYLCYHLALKGFHCYLGRKSYINYLLKNLKGYIYLDKGYHKGVSEKIYEAIKNNDGIIVSLDEEGGVDYTDHSTLLGRYAPTLFANADLTFFWGEKQYETVKHNMGDKAKALITGHPRFELLKPQFHYLYRDKVDKIKQRFQDFILINTNMGFGNNIKGDDFVAANYGERFKNIDQIIAFDKDKLEAYKSLLLELSAKVDRPIVLRPHPEEDQSHYLDALKGRENIHVVNEGSVIPWLLAADIMVHPDCTTAIESFFVGKRPISYLPESYPSDLVTNLPQEVSRCFTSESNLITFLQNGIHASSATNIEGYPFAEEYFSISKPTMNIIVDEIDLLKNDLPGSQCQSLSLGTKTYLKYKALRSKSVNNISAQLIRNKLKGFSFSEVNQIHEKIRSQNSTGRQIKLHKITRSLFSFTG